MQSRGRKGIFGFRDIEIMRAVVRAGGFRAAAQRTGLAQSAISARIAALEARLGIKVFDRVGRQVRLSTAGRRLLEEAERLIENRDRIVKELTQESGLNGTVRIGVAETIVHTILTPMLNLLHDQHPSVRFELAVDTSEQLAQRLVEDDLDTTILLRESLPHGCLSTPLRPVELDWYASAEMVLPKTPLSISQLAEYPIVTFPKATPPYKQIEKLFTCTDGATPILHGSASLSTVLHLVGDGFGIGVLPSRMVDARPLGAAGNVRRLPTTADAHVADLHFVIAYFPERNKEAGEIITRAALAADRL